MHNSYPLPTFLPQPQPVEFISELVEIKLEGSSAILHCRSKRFEPLVHNFYGTQCEVTFEPPVPGADTTVRLDFCTAEIMRVRWARGTLVPENDTPMVVGEFTVPVNLNLKEYADKAVLETGAIRVEVIREPWQLRVLDLKGNLIWATRPVDIEPLRRPVVQWNPPQERWLFLHRYAYPCGLTAEGPKSAFASFDLRHDEHIYGLGEDFGRLDKRNVERRLWIQEGFGNSSPASYKQTPFYISTRGYGLYWNTSNAIKFNIGSLEHTALSVVVEESEWVDFYWIYGPTIKDILPRYTAITGAPGVPPEWSFGLWMARITYDNQAQVEAVAEELRAHNIPCDVIHIDTGWYEIEWVCDLDFSHTRFPNPFEMMARLREKGFRVSLWQLPNLIIESCLFAEAAEKGYLAKRPYGKPYLLPGFLSEAGILDYSNAEAVAWIKEKFRCLFAQGAAVIKADFGEGAPPDAVYSSVKGEAMHNLFPLLYNQAVFEATEEYFGKGQGIIWARSAWAGSQRYPLHWSGDGIARYEDLACVLRSALSFGMSGFPFYSHDVGGFSGIPSPDLYARWIQFGAFSSHVRCHGQPPREPWEYGEEVEGIFRKFMELRYRLLPYILTEARDCGRTSLPMLRALALEFQEDATTFGVEDEYMFGGSILVAPILDETGRRRVYLPAGGWVDYWSKAVINGPVWIDVEAPLDRIPLYVRAGSLLPYGPLVQYVGEKSCDPLTLELYHPTGNSSHHFELGGGLSLEAQVRVTPESLEVSLGAAPGVVELICFGVGVQQAVWEGKPVPVTRREDSGTVIHFDGKPGGSLVIKIG